MKLLQKCPYTYPPKSLKKILRCIPDPDEGEWDEFGCCAYAIMESWWNIYRYQKMREFRRIKESLKLPRNKVTYH